MTTLRRAGLGLLVVLLLAVSAAAVGYASRGSTGPDLDGGAAVQPVAQDAPAQPAVDPVAQPVQPAAEPSPRTADRPRSQKQPLHAMEPGRTLLSFGDRGMKVRDLQARLAALAWYFSRPDGRYDAETVKAVRGFQAKRQIPVTGKVDQRTLDRLHAMTGEPTRDQMGLHNKPGPLDDRCRTGRVLCIDKTSRTLRWLVDGKVLKTVDVRFGATGTPTREGVYSVYFKSRDHVSSLYDSSMPFAMFFSGGQAVHYSSDFAATGYSGASHGCVNVRDYAAVSWLFDQVRVGDKVVVYWS
ncbi:L,D-transpeptidase family protein [Nocardioides halotolerans]|jgi:peptidoglycan hydrolase-like protein with peptidoglycan-binding domain|uniref:L,D-transpeptidase family protein n=1 Tax=Nocardioides halotolerans TaxID=433660 RepID=UPI00041F974B|nr:L,D-transpeptidase family protein [Nocardioides halotolerans]